VSELEPRLGPAPALALDPTPTTRTMRVERWRELLAAGRLLDGLRAAERADFDQVCRAATAKELLALSDAGRFFGPSKRAVAALTALRRRFPGSMEAGTAAFTLGRIVFEKEQAYARAANWFETYLREQPTGPLMGDAFGRLMEARLRAGDGAGARASAEQYLRRFPEGPYASEARGILSR
jgi:outer membrane protein assembly factor BamD (BamD/ComL family)